MPQPTRDRHSKPAQATADVGTSCLAHLLQVLNDPTAAPAERDRAARLAARLVHGRPLAVRKKVRQAMAEAWEG